MLWSYMYDAQTLRNVLDIKLKYAYENRKLPYPGLAGALANFSVQKVHFQTDSAMSDELKAAI